MPLFNPKPPKKADPPAPPEPPAPPPPVGMSKEEIQEILGGIGTQFAGALGKLNERIEELATRQPQVVVQSPDRPVAEPVGPNDGDLDTAILSGQGAAAHIRAIVDREVAKATQGILTNYIKPMQDYGVNTLGELSKRVTAGSMPLYKEYQKEIEAELNKLTPDVRSNPTVIETFYYTVVGRHAAEREARAAEAAVRQAQEAAAAGTAASASKSATPGTGAASGGTRTPEDEIPSVEAFLGSHAEDGLEALQHKGRSGQDQDAFAQSMGYENWASYMKMYHDLMNDTAGNA